MVEGRNNFTAVFVGRQATERSSQFFAASQDLGLLASLGLKCQNGNRKDGRLIHVTIANLTPRVATSTPAPLAADSDASIITLETEKRPNGCRQCALSLMWD